MYPAWNCWTLSCGTGLHTGQAFDGSQSVPDSGPCDGGQGSMTRVMRGHDFDVVINGLVISSCLSCSKPFLRYFVFL